MDNEIVREIRRRSAEGVAAWSNWTPPVEDLFAQLSATPGAPPGVEGAVCLYTRDLDGVVVEIMIIDDPPPEENKAPPSEG